MGETFMFFHFFASIRAALTVTIIIIVESVWQTKRIVKNNGETGKSRLFVWRE